MPNTKSAKKAVRGSAKKRSHNLLWKGRFKGAIKNIKKGLDSKEALEVLQTKVNNLQKILDKSAKEKVIHKNKANRLKSKYAHQIAEISKNTEKKPAKGK